MKIKKINGWSYKTEDNSFIISNCGDRVWFSAQIDAEATQKHGFEVALENSKMYHRSYADAKNWVLRNELVVA